LLIAACSSQLPSPPPTQLTGEWGGDRIQITDSAAAHAIIVSTFCNVDLYPVANVDSAGEFDVHGVRFQSTNVFDVGDSVHMTGTVRGSTLDVYLALTRLEGEGPPAHHTLTRNQPPDRTGLICLE
jgi:hypothetical protein